MIINYKLFNPLGFHLLKLFQDKTIRNIILYGGSSSGKTYSVAQIVLIFTIWEGSNTLVMRKVGASIKDTVYQDFKTAVEQLGISKHFKFSDGVKTIKCLDNDARIVFKGLDDSEKIKGLSSFKRVILDEWSEFDESDYKQIRLRLRGMEGQQIICTFNPIKETHWIKKSVFDKQKWHDIPMTVELAGTTLPEVLTKVKSIKMNEPRVIMHKRTGEMIEHSPDTVVIQTTYLNNYWVVGSPCGTYGYYDEQCIATFEYDRENDPDYYNVYALGEWGVIRTGSEFFGSFNRGIHSGDVKYNSELPVHICVDSNVLPYISITYWQILYDKDKCEIQQIGETCAESPNNTVRKSAKLVVKKLNKLGVDKVILHGDASTKAANNIDDEKRSFHDLFIDTLQKNGIEVEDKVSTKNPSVPMSGEFINAIFDCTMPNLNILIGEECRSSIEDYMSVQKDMNGAILKTRVKNKITGQTYEEHGHLCFTPDTPVISKRGNIAIKDVRIDDEVLTEKGWQKVYNSLCTIRNSQYFLLSLNEQEIGCTFDHRIHTARGFIPACDLKEGDIITRTKDNKQWQEKLSYTTASDFIATLTANAKAIRDIIADGLGLKGDSSKHPCTDTYGISHTEKCLKGIVYIILMAITIITHFLILPLCLLTSMRNFILRNMEKLLGTIYIKDWKRQGRPQQNGINLVQDENGIKRTVRIFGKTNRWWNMFAKSVEKPLKVIPNKLRNFVLTTAKANGDECRELTMRSAFVRCVGLNLLSIDILRHNAVHGNVLLRIGGISDVYDISTTSQTFFANGVLVHNCDTFRYIVVDVYKDEFIAFSNRRKRNLYARDGVIHFYNLETKCKYTADVLYTMPNLNGKFGMVHGKLCGNKWHIVYAELCDTTSTEEMQKKICSRHPTATIIECAPSYYPFVKELRKELEGVRVMKEQGDIDRRIVATSDYVKTNILFNQDEMNDDLGYANFITNLLDYNKDVGSKEASSVLSGFIRYVIKSFSN